MGLHNVHSFVWLIGLTAEPVKVIHAVACSSASFFPTAA